MMTVVHRSQRKPIRRTPLPDGVINGAAFTITAHADTTGPVLSVPETTIRDLDDVARLEHILKAYKAARTEWATR